MEERTLILLKPDSLQRSIVGKIISRIEQRGLKIVAMKMIQLDEDMCQKHYSHLVQKPFYPKLVGFMTSAPIVAMVVQGVEAIKVIRDMCGPTNARNALAGTIRGDYSLSTQYNTIHASDSKESAEAEVQRFFTKEQIHDWKRMMDEYTNSQDEK
jgi:nucleoside-diphosphate kinase